jgi:hypothetical protein
VRTAARLPPKTASPRPTSCADPALGEVAMQFFGAFADVVQANLAVKLH